MFTSRKWQVMPIGLIAFEANIAQIVPAKIRRIAVVVTYGGRDEEGFDYSERVKIHKLDRDTIIKLAVDAYEDAGLNSYKPDYEYRNPRTLEEVLDFVRYHYEGDGEYCGCRIMKPSDFRKEKEAKERTACEAIAAHICSVHKVAPGTVEFIRAARKHYKKTTDAERDYRTNPEIRMERYAAYDDKANFFNDNDYSSGIERSARAEYARLLRYLRKYTPLLMAQYKEWKLARKKKA